MVVKILATSITFPTVFTVNLSIGLACLTIVWSVYFLHFEYCGVSESVILVILNSEYRLSGISYHYQSAIDEYCQSQYDEEYFYDLLHYAMDYQKGRGKQRGQEDKCSYEF